MSISKINRLPLRSERVKFSDPKTQKHFSQYFVLLTQKNTTTNIPRVGMIVSKKSAPLAVTRNHIRRLFSEALRGNLDHLPPLDYLVIFNQKASIATFQDFQNEIKKTFPY